jgi:RsiW-degrading membrane proteinase PrsW (M82 family)
MLHLLLVAAAGVAAIAWVGYFRWKDAEHPEPLWLMGAVLLGGVAAAFLALAKYLVMEKVGLGTDWENLAGPDLVRAARLGLRIGFIEEGCKLLPVAALVLFSKQVDEPLDGIVYAGCAALGLATAETAMQVYNEAFGLWDGLARALTAPIAHALLSAPWGLGLARYALSKRLWPAGVGFLVSVVAHGSYDVLLARPELPPVAAAGVVLALWGWLIWLTPRLAKERAPVPTPTLNR